MSERPWSECGARLRRLREQRGIDQIAFARKTGMAQSVISRLELGARVPRAATRTKLGAALGMTLAKFDAAVGPMPTSESVQPATSKSAGPLRTKLARRLHQLAIEIDAALSPRG